MKSFARSLVACAVLVAALPLFTQAAAPAGVAPPKAPRARTSPHETINAIVEGNYQAGKRVVIVYGRPFSKNPRGADIRKVWGTLVPWDKIWRLGADEATLLITETTLQFGETSIGPGAYSLYMLPSETGASKLVINKAIGQWGLTYDEKQDVARVDLKKETLNTSVDQFTMTLQPKQGGGGGTLLLDWETTQYSVEFTTKK